MKRVMAILMMMAVAGVTYGEILAAWENNDQDTATTNKFADTTAAGVSSAELSFGNGLTEIVYNDAFSTRDDLGWNNYETNLADAVAADARYIISLDFSQVYDLTNMFVRLAMQNANPSNAMATFTLRSSLTGATDLDSYQVIKSGGNSEFTTDLSGVSALQGITAVDFYLYLHLATTDNGGYSQNGIGWPYNVDASNDLVIYGESGGPITPPATTYRFK